MFSFRMRRAAVVIDLIDQTGPNRVISPGARLALASRHSRLAGLAAARKGESVNSVSVTGIPVLVTKNVET